MPSIKYDVTGVDDVQDGNPAPVGMYRARVKNVDGPKASSKGNTMLEVVFELTHDAQGKKLTESFMPLWYYPLFDHESAFVNARLKEFLFAFGLKPKGALDPEKLVGKSVQVKLKSDTDQDGDYRPRIAKVLGLATADEPEPDEPDDEAEPDDDEEELDLSAMSRIELKRLIKEEELDIKVLKSMSDDALRDAIAEAMAVDEDEDEAEPDDEDDEEEDDESTAASNGHPEDYSSWTVADLKKELAERELPANGSKKVLAARLTKDDGDDPF